MTTAAEHLPIREAESRHVLRASITADAERQYAVSFRPGDHGPLSEQSYLRFALHYYARVLYELARTERSVRDLPAVIERIAAGTIGWHDDLFTLAGVHGRIVQAVREPVGDVIVTLRQRGVREFDVEGTFGLSGRLLAISVIAVLEAALPRLAADGVGAMLSALANMNVSYTITHHYGDMNSCREVPAIAYLAASFV